MTGTGDKEAEKAAREAAWWKRWWAMDYSWEGLGKRHMSGTPHKRWLGWSVAPGGQCMETLSAPTGSELATLQDYFRWNPETEQLLTDRELERAGLLIRDGTARQPDFHILHLPLAYADGTSTFKSDSDAADWASLEAFIARLLAQSSPTGRAIDDDDCTTADHRAQLHGAVLRAFPRPSEPEVQFPLHLAASRAIFLKRADAQRLEFGSPANFAQTLFCAPAKFTDSQFAGGEANFRDAQFSGGDANFKKAHFSGGNAYFMDAQFSGNNANFSEAQFSGGETYFRRAQFSGRANFSDAQFSGGDTNFWKARFSGGDANFWKAQFSGGGANFRDAQFFGGDANFRTTRFSGGEAIFVNASFLHGACFAGARFLKACEFGRSNQPESVSPAPGARFVQRLDTRGAYFEGRADFSRVSFPDKAEDRNSAFEGARFFEPLDLKGVERLPFSAFHGIRLDKGLLLDSYHPEPDQFDQALADAEAAIARDDARDPEDTDRAPERSGADARYAALEAGCRALKEAMAADGDRKREQSFFSHELAARERRVRHRLEELKAGITGLRSRLKALSARAELTASQAYHFFSGYGGSILRPLVTLLASFPLVAAALGFLTCAFALAGNSQLSDVCLGMECGPTMHPIASNTLEAAFRGMLGPFRLLLGRGEPFAYLGDTAPVFRGLVALVMLLHGLASSALIFLWLLALRRQFQIN